MDNIYFPNYCIDDNKVETRKREKRQETENGGLFIAYHNVIPCDAKDSILLTTCYYHWLAQAKAS